MRLRTVWRALLAIATAAWGAWSPVARAETISVCPSTFRVEQRAEAPPGWSTVVDGRPRALSMVTFFDGPPDQLASLKYDEEVTRDDHWIATWSFLPNPRGYWISCAYDGAAVSLIRELPASVTRCQVTYERLVRFASGVPVVKRIDCR